MCSVWREDDLLPHIEDEMRSTMLEVDETVVASRRLSVRATAQIDLDNGDLELCTENGLEVFTVEEALELLELLSSQRDTLYALAHQ